VTPSALRGAPGKKSAFTLQVFPEVCALMEMLAVNCPHTCDVERANALVKLFKDERSNRLTPQSLFHKLRDEV
jgi:hypothetical protein